MTTSLLNDGSTCYINNVLQAQLWTSIMTLDLDLDTWDAWTQPILNIFNTHAGEAIFPYNDSYLAHHLREWFSAHASPAQSDAGEFAGWLRGQMFEKVLISDQYLTLHAWNARLSASTEDNGSLISSIILRSLLEADMILQQAIRQWHRQESFIHALRIQNHFVCIQFECHPALNIRPDHAMIWDHSHVLMPGSLLRVLA